MGAPRNRSAAAAKSRAAPAIRWLLAGALSAGSAEAACAQAKSAPLGADVKGLLTAAHRLSPQLRAASLETVGASAKAEGADALDDPTITDSYQYYKDPGVFSAHTVLLTQSFPLWGKLDLRRQAAFADVDAARGRERAAQDALDERIKVAYAQYYLATCDIAVNREVAALAEQMNAAASARYGQGGGDQASVIRVLGEATTAKIEAVRLEGEVSAARARLNALVARPADAPLAEPRLLGPMPSPEPRLDALLGRARMANPTLSAGAADIAAARTRSTLADKAWYPDLTLGAGPLIQTNNRPVGVAATVELNIPLPWGREASGQQEAAAKLGASQQMYDATLLEIEGALGEAVAKLRATRSAEALIRREALPQARATFQSVLANYSQGKGELEAAIAAEHQIHEAELTLLQTQLEEQVELAAIERLIGGDL